MKTNMRVTIEVEGNTLVRDYALTDGQVPEDMQENVQDMVDTLLDNNN